MCFCSEDTGTGKTGETEDNQSNADQEHGDGEGELGGGGDVVLHPEEGEDGQGEQEEGVNHQDHVQYCDQTLQAGEDCWACVEPTELHPGLLSQLSLARLPAAAWLWRLSHCGSNHTPHHTPT